MSQYSPDVAKAIAIAVKSNKNTALFQL